MFFRADPSLYCLKPFDSSRKHPIAQLPSIDFPLSGRAIGPYDRKAHTSERGPVNPTPIPNTPSEAFHLTASPYLNPESRT